MENEKDTLDIILEENPEMYALAGIELVPVPVPAPVPVQARIESTSRQAMASVPPVHRTTVNFKVVVVNDLNNCGPITY